jgi:hypothetical protein
MRGFLIALLFAAIAINPAASQRSSSGFGPLHRPQRTSLSPRLHPLRSPQQLRQPRKSGPHSRSHARSTSTRCTTCERDATGRIKRNSAARRDFQSSHPCPATGRTSGTCPGYVVDHIVPLKRGGGDDPSNMQWQTAAEAKKKTELNETHPILYRRDDSRHANAGLAETPARPLDARYSRAGYRRRPVSPRHVLEQPAADANWRPISPNHPKVVRADHQKLASSTWSLSELYQAPDDERAFDPTAIPTPSAGH